MISKKLLSILCINFAIQSCSFNHLNDPLKNTDCKNTKQEIETRLKLFKKADTIVVIIELYIFVLNI